MDNNKKKALYIVTQTEWGGAQKYVYELVTSPEALNYDLIVAVGKNKDKTLINKLKEQNIKVIELKHLIRPISLINDVLAIFELKKLYQKIKPDIIHTNSSKPSILGAYAFSLSGLKNARLIHTVHGWAFNESINWLKKKIYLLAEKATAKYKDKIIFIAEFDRQAAIKYIIAKEKKLITIHNGINVDDIKFLSKEEAQEKLFKDYKLTDLASIPPHPPSDGGGKIIIGTIANFYKTKGLEYFIQAIKKSESENIIGVVIGDGNSRLELENLINNLNLKNQFLLLGRYANAPQYLKAFDIYISSSVKEGLPYSILEAMAAQLPIVATRVGGIPEIIKDSNNGLLIEPKNPAVLAEKINILINNQQLRQTLAEQAERDVKEKFNQQQMIKKTFELYL